MATETTNNKCPTCNAPFEYIGGSAPKFKDQQAVKAVAASFRPNPDFSSEKVLGELATGEALSRGNE